MSQLAPDRAVDIEARMPEARARLVRLCAYLSGDRDAAEDLAQETLIEAWRSQGRLTDPAGYQRWLAAIARNVCMRWARRRGRERAHDASYPDAALGAPLEQFASADDLEVELERDELATLLDRALAFLPPETQRILIEKYIEELPLAEQASRLGLSEGALAVRLHRGRLALRRVLTTELGHEAAAYGLLEPAAAGWDETRIWCPVCGARRLIGRLDPAIGELALRCPACTEPPDIYVSYVQLPDLLRGARSYRPAFAKVLAWADAYYRPGLFRRTLPCMSCGAPTRLGGDLPSGLPDVIANIGPILVHCDSCHTTISTARTAIGLCLPEGRQFWRDHPRIQVRPSYEVMAGGRPAVVSRFASVAGSAHLDVITDRDSFEVLGVHWAG
jgi:RNA polymerase sigma-70 factor (ECF subfamily)